MPNKKRTDSSSLRRISIGLILIILAVTACRREEVASTGSAPSATAAAAVAAPTAVEGAASSAETVAPTATPEPTPLVPSITAEDQVLEEAGQVTLAAVTSPGPGWVLIHAQRGGQVGEILGYTAVEEGVNTDVVITIDPLQASPVLAAVLHKDAGEAGKLEFPGPDTPLKDGAAAVSASFNVDIRAPIPAVTVADQEITEEGLVRIESVVAPAPGWVVVYADEAGEIGPVLGETLVPEGSSEDVVVHINWHDGTPQLYALLHEDSGRQGRFDYPEADLPLIVDAEPVVAPFRVTLPRDVAVLDQPVVNGEVVIDRVISYWPAWLVVYADDDGEATRIIGFAPLQEGVNEQVVVPVVETAVTPRLFILLHEDTVPGDKFNFPKADPIIREDGHLPTPFSFRTNPGNYLVTQDQALDSEEAAAITIPLAVTYTDTWLVIWRGEAAEAGEIVGVRWLPAGIHRDVGVEVAGVQTGDQLFAAFHWDTGEPEQFDYPESDVPIIRNGNIVQSPLLLIPNEE